MPAQANARVAPRVNINPASEVLQVSEGRARDLALATILWWNLRGHRASAAAASTEGRPLLAPQLTEESIFYDEFQSFHH